MKLTRVKEFPHDIMLGDSNLSISIYMPTHKGSEDWRQDRLRFKNLITEVENSLSENMNKVDLEKVLKPLYDTLEYPYFWNEVADGLAILLNENQAIYYLLNRLVEEYVEVSNQFYLKPLIRNFQSYDKYHVLGISKDEFKLYEGSRYSFEEVKLDEDIITNKEDLLDEDRKGRVLSFGSYAGSYSGGSNPSMHGHNTKQEGLERDTKKFFRYVDYVVRENYTSNRSLPLILMGLSENQGEFRNISRNKNLLDKGIDRSLTSIDVKELHKIVWQLIEPIYLKKTEDLLGDYAEARSELIASSDPLEIAHACQTGRVDRLIVEADRVISKVYDRESGELIEGDLKKYDIGDLINQLAIMTFSQGGEVIVLPKERFPEASGCAAIFRY